MNTLYQLQFACFIVTAMLAMMLLISRFQMKWLNKRYENSRWLIFFSMVMLAVHYVLQMHHGLRAKSDEIGAVINILFYTPIAFLISYATYNIVSNREGRKRFLWISTAFYVLIVACFLVGFLMSGSLEIGVMLNAMFGLFLLCLSYFIITVYRKMRQRRKRLEYESGTDLLPYDRYIWSSYILMCVTVLMLMGGIVYRPFLMIIGPFVLLSLFIFTMSFISFGFNLMPTDAMLEEQEDFEETEKEQGHEGKDNNMIPPLGLDEDDKEVLTEERKKKIEEALQTWCEAGGFRDSTANMGSLSKKVRISREALSVYFERHLKSTFRIWLSDIRFKEAQRMLKENPEYSNDTISSECGFSSHAHLYKIFKTKTGMTPGQWKEYLPAKKHKK